MRGQVARLLERAIGKLPENFRTVFVLREVEGLSVEETADVLQVPKETVKTRLLRARRRLQQELDPELREALLGAFPFAGADCDRLTERVLANLRSRRQSPAARPYRLDQRRGFRHRQRALRADADIGRGLAVDRGLAVRRR